MLCLLHCTGNSTFCVGGQDEIRHNFILATGRNLTLQLHVHNYACLYMNLDGVAEDMPAPLVRDS